MNVLFVSNDPTLFDTQSAARERMRAYAAEIALTSGSLHIISPAPKDIEQSEASLSLHGVRVHKLFASNVLAKRARKLIELQYIDVVSAQDPFEYGLAAMQAVAGTNAKLHIQIHTDFLSVWFTNGASKMALLNRARVSIADRVLPAASGIRVVSERVRDSVVKRYGAKVATPVVIPIAVSATLPEPVRLPSHPFAFSFITIGRLEEEKRIDDIITALSMTRGEFQNVGLFVVGEGRQEKALKRRAKEFNLEDRVIFLGNRPDAWGLMRSCSAYIQASAYEGYGRTLIEAALARIPIITTDVGIVGEVLRPGDALISPAGDPTSLGVNIARLVQDPQRRTLLPIEAEKKAREHLGRFPNQPHLVVQDLARVLGNRVA